MRSAGLRIQGPSARLHPVHLFTAEGQKTAWGLTIKCVSIHFRKAENVDNFVDFLWELDYWEFSMRRAVLPVWHFWMLAWILFPPALTLKKINSYSRKRQASILWLAGFWLWMMYKLLFFSSYYFAMYVHIWCWVQVKFKVKNISGNMAKVFGHSLEPSFPGHLF